MSTSDTLSVEIDLLLERYLHLLDQYTSLREQLAAAQSLIQQHIARANFTADRGVRYGQDHYDARLQAIKLLEIDVEKATINVVPAAVEQEHTQKSTSEGSTDDDTEDTTSSKIPPVFKSNNPLRMFGILVPQALRQAQAQSVKLVEVIVPKLVNINLEMERTEIEIRRKRKHKAKAEAQKTAPGLQQHDAVESTA